MHIIHCTFRPQAWVRDYAIDVDLDGDPNWQMTVDELPRLHSHESDELREDPAAPEWVRNWRGPFEVDYEVLSPNLTPE